jgi:VNT family MFS transporter (synaptic vesicle glycoprotein 2)
MTYIKIIFHSLNTLRLWLPQIFQAINDYQYFHNESSAGLCEMLQMIKPATKSDECVVVSISY